LMGQPVPLLPSVFTVHLHQDRLESAMFEAWPHWPFLKTAKTFWKLLFPRVNHPGDWQVVYMRNWTAPEDRRRLVICSGVPSSRWTRSKMDSMEETSHHLAAPSRWPVASLLMLPLSALPQWGIWNWIASLYGEDVSAVLMWTEGITCFGNNVGFLMALSTFPCLWHLFSLFSTSGEESRNWYLTFGFLCVSLSESLMSYLCNVLFPNISACLSGGLYFFTSSCFFFHFFLMKN
jgi:hypothetical protein